MTISDQEWRPDTPGDIRPFSGEAELRPSGEDREFFSLNPRLTATVLYQVQVERGAVDVLLMTERGAEELDSTGVIPSVAVWEDSSVRGVDDVEQVYGAVPPGDYELTIFAHGSETEARCEIEGYLTAGWRA